jgi:hypothetical protein
MQLATLEVFDPPHATALTYPAAATAVLAAWLTQHGGNPGDHVVGGIDTHATLLGAKGAPIASCRLPALLDYNDRPADDVLRAVHEPLQR